MKFGSLCGIKRKAAGLSIQDLSVKSSLAVKVIISIESGKKSPHIGEVVALIRGLRITPQELDAIYGGLWPREEQSHERESAKSEDQAEKIPWYRREDL